MVTKSIEIENKELIPLKDYELHGKVIVWWGNGDERCEYNYENGKYKNGTIIR